MESSEADRLFRQLDAQLAAEVDAKFFIDPKIYKSLTDVVEIVNKNMGKGGNKDAELLSALNDNDLVKQCYCVLNVIERVVKFQHGGLNNSVDTMSEVLRSYNSNREEIRVLRSSLLEARNVLTQKRQDNTSLKELWLQKIEAEESLRILDSLEKLKDAPSQVTRLMQQRRYVCAVCALNTAIGDMFNDDLVGISALDSIRQQLMEMKGGILEAIVGEVKSIILEDAEEETGGDVKETEAGGEQSREDVEGSEVRSETSFKGSMSEPRGRVQRGVEGVDEWSTDLSSVTEEFERSLAAPAQSKPLFARLLVRAVGLLNCEDDVDRFLLEEGSLRFQVTIKALRERVTAALEGRSVNTDTALISADNDAAKNFNAYACCLLEKGVAVLKRLLHVLHLLSMSKCKLEREEARKEVDLSLKKATGAAVVQIWTDIERAIFTELQVHFAEQSVEQISDKTLVSRDRIAMRRRSGTSSHMRRQVSADDDEFKDRMYLEDLPPLFPPSAHLAAPIYKDVVLFSEQAYALLSADISFELLVDADAQGNSVRICNAVLDFMKRFLEDELMPVVQGAINREMREIQLNAETLSTPVSIVPEAPKSVGESRVDAAVCKAARMVLDSVSPLFAMYLELPQHRDATVTILDRAIRGFVSIAREEVEAVSYRWRSAEEAQLKAVVAGMTKDPLFLSYRRHVYDGKDSVEELAMPAGGKVAAASAQATGRRGSRIFTAASMASMLQSVQEGGEKDGDRGNAREQDSWGDLWKIGGSSAVYGADRFADDMDAISKVVSIAHGCDWLVNQLFKKFNHAIKPAKNPKKASTALAPAAFVQFRTTIQTGAMELSKLAEECIALMRGEMQMSCFHFLHSLSQMKSAAIEHTRATFIAKNMKSYSADGDDKTKSQMESEVVIASLHNHLFAFQRAVIGASSAELMVVLISPLCSVVPKILSICAKQLSVASKSDVIDLNDYEYESMKTRFLRAVAACQHMLSALLEEAKPDPRSHRLLQDIASEDFEITRRVADIIEHPAAAAPSKPATNIIRAPAPPVPAAGKSVPPRATVPTAPAATTVVPNTSGPRPPPQQAPLPNSKIESFFESVAAKFNNK